jgi:hypothetical protein
VVVWLDCRWVVCGQDEDPSEIEGGIAVTVGAVGSGQTAGSGNTFRQTRMKEREAHLLPSL